MKKAFKDAGFNLVYSPTQNNDQQKRIQAFNKFVNDEVDAIVLSATNDSGWDDCLENAAEAEIPVFTVDRNINIRARKPRRQLCPISARPMCGQVSRLRNSSIRASRLEPTASFWKGPAGLSVVTDRGQGWKNKAADNIKVLESQSANWSTDEAKTVTAGLLDKYKSDNPQFIFAENDEMGLGAAQAVDAAGLKGKVESSPSMAPGSAFSLFDGDLSYVIEYNPIFGKETANAVKDYLGGKSVEKDIEIRSKTFDAASARLWMPEPVHTDCDGRRF